jgi:PKD repeat protein
VNRNGIAKYILAPGLALGILGPAGPAAAVDYYLCAGTITKNLPGGTPVPMWGFAQVASAAAQVSGCGGAATVPGPKLTVPVGEGLAIHLYNDGLPEPVSVVIPGQRMPAEWTGPVRHVGGPYDGRVRSFTHEAAPGASATYTWTALDPGSYLYESGTHPQVQVQMGLYGAVAKSQAPGEAYPGVAHDAERDLFYSEIDPALHAAVNNGSYGTTGPTSTLGYLPKYFLINGEPFEAGDACINGGLTQGNRILLRFYNAGLRELTPTMLGAHFAVVAEGGKKHPFPREQYSVLLPPGSTRDLVFTPARSGTFPIIDRRLNLTNAAATGGGFQTCLQIAAQAGLPVAEANGPYTGQVNIPISFSSAGSSDDGSIVSYAWSFGDGQTDSAANPSHAYGAPGTYGVSLVVTDNEGHASAPDYTTAKVNGPPAITSTPVTEAKVGTPYAYDVEATDPNAGDTLTFSLDASPAGMTIDPATGVIAWTPSAAQTGAHGVTVRVTDDGIPALFAAQSFTVTAAAANQAPTADPDGPYSGTTNVAISFDGTGSTDPEGQPLTYSWDFGDSGTGTGPTPSHAYAAAGTYTVTLTVSDGTQNSSPATTTATVAAPSRHVGDLDGARATVPGSRWRALVTATVHDQGHNPVAGATVTGVWNAGDANGRTLSCTTAGNGRCTVQSGRISNSTASVTFLVTNVAAAGAVYQSSDNHDPDGDSNGTSITVPRLP